MDGSLICLYQEHTTNLVETIKTITKFNYDMIITPIVNPLFYRNFLNETQHINYTRSDLILSYNDWVRQVIPKIDNSVDCDSKDDHIRWHSESTLHQEMAFANHLSDTGYSLIRLNYRESFANLARIISTCKSKYKFVVYFMSKYILLDIKKCNVLHAFISVLLKTNLFFFFFCCLLFLIYLFFYHLHKHLSIYNTVTISCK